MTMVDAVSLMAKSTVSRMLERKDFRQRFDEQRPIHQHEFLYPLLQAYDSVVLECDVELGGTDQLFNLTLGRDLMNRYGKRPQIVMTTPILEGTDARYEGGVIVGKKMSKSADNYIGLQEDPLAMFRKAMQIDDDVIFRFFELLSARTPAEIAALKQEKAGGRNPMEIKAIFAREIVERFHDAGAAERAAREFAGVYGEGAPCPTTFRPSSSPRRAGSPSSRGRSSKPTSRRSTSAARRLVEQGGVEVDGQRVTDPKTRLLPGSVYLVRVGSKSRRFARIRIAPG